MTKKRKKEKIAIFDIDDTMFDFLGGLCKVHNLIHQTNIKPEDIPSWDLDNDLGTEDIYGRIIEDANLGKTFQIYEGEGLYLILEPFFESEQALSITEKLGYKIVLLTARNKKFRLQTELSLMRNKINYDKLIFNKNKVDEINKLSEKYDVVLFADDRASTVKSVNNNCKVKYPILINRTHNQHAKIGHKITRVNDLLECIKFLRQEMGK